MFQIGGGHNSNEAVLKVAEMVIRESRAARVQPFNEYRKRFKLKPYTSFSEFTGEQQKMHIYNFPLKVSHAHTNTHRFPFCLALSVYKRLEKPQSNQLSYAANTQHQSISGLGGIEI